MKQVLIDSNVILDLFLDDPVWAQWSATVLQEHEETHLLCINAMIYAEISIGFRRIEELERAISACGFKFLAIPREALFLAGKVFLKYRRAKGRKTSPLPDFFIAAHAAVSKLPLITRDRKRISHYFPTIELITPNR
jgi:predicted nucleic acid-binding protein